MNKHQLPVTVVIPVKNEEANLSGCLERLGRFEQVLVVDSDSLDQTPAIAQNGGAVLLQFQWNGHYPKKRNWVLLNYRFQTEWALFLDADEYVNDAFCEELDRAISTQHNDGYWINYTNYFLGSELKHGVSQRKLALLRVGYGLYERIDEEAWSSLDMEVHEHPVIEGATGEIAARIEHRDHRGIDKFLDRHRDYAKWEANRFLLLEKELGKSTRLSRRQRFKYANIDRWWYPWLYFMYAYVVKLGVLDGTAGFYYAFYKAWYFLSVRLLIAELRSAKTVDGIVYNQHSRTSHEAGSKPMQL